MSNRESKAVGTEGLGLFTEAWVAASLGLPLSGEALRDKALADHAENYRKEIQMVRVALLAGATLSGATTLTADDASLVADQMHLPGAGPKGERRWLGGVFQGWKRVKATDRTVMSTLPRRHSRRITVWALLPEAP